MQGKAAAGSTACGNHDVLMIIQFCRDHIPQRVHLTPTTVACRLEIRFLQDSPMPRKLNLNGRWEADRGRRLLDAPHLQQRLSRMQETDQEHQAPVQGILGQAATTVKRVTMGTKAGQEGIQCVRTILDLALLLQ